MTNIEGWTAPGFESVRAAFEANFERGTEAGAAFSAYHRGRQVVDLWGGVADVESGAPWVEDTIGLVFSTTKGWTAIAANHLVERGKLELSAPVTEYWPEFGASGKEAITVDHLLSHRAGLEWVDRQLSFEQALAWHPVIEALEAQQPRYPAGTAHGYHALTFGYLVGEVVRRASGQTVGEYLRDQIAEPLGLDLWIGLPDEHQHRVADLVVLEGGIAADFDADSSNPLMRMLAPFLGPDGVLTKALGANLGAFDDPHCWNSREVRAAEIPAGNGICDARSLARIYAACIGEVDGARVLSAERLTDATTQRTSGPNTVLMNLDVQFGLGFMLRTSLLPIGGPRSFGHFGLGGSMGWADPDAELAFGYLMNKPMVGMAGDVRSSSLVKACYQSLHG